MSLVLITLGRLEILWDGRPAPELTLRKSQALLIYLALNPGRHDRSRLAGLLWGDLPEKNARRNLRHALHCLRSALDPEVVESDRLSAGLNPDVLIQVDALDFEKALARAERCRREKHLAAEIDHLETAVELYQGNFLSRFDVTNCLEFEAWATRRRARLREQMLDALDTLTDHWTRHGDYERALRHARRLLALEPLWESSHRRMMTLLALTGQRSAALAQYQECRRVLETELGLEPLEETQALYDRLVEWETGRSVYQSTNLPIYQPANLPFTGREEEHATLVKSWEASQHNASHLTLVEGEAGVGKTRLLEEVLRYVETQGATVLRGRCYEFGGGLPYQPIAQALRSILDIRYSTPNLQSPISNLKPVWLAELALLVPEVREMRPELPKPTPLPGEAARQRLFEAVARFLGSLARPSCVIFLDDLHWADQSTLDLLHYLVHRLTGAPVWLVGAYRPEEVGLSHSLTRLRQGLSRDHRVERLALGPLSGASVLALARSLVGDQDSVALGDLLYRESEGNPFILVETVSALQEEGALRRAGEHLVWAGAPATERVPASVQDVILQRVGRLSQAAQRLLTLASVVGQPFNAPLLENAARQSADRVADSLDEWLARRLVQQRPTAPMHPRFSPLHSPVYDFSHDKIRAVVYHAVEQPRRQRLHRRVGEAIERMFSERPDQLDEYVALLAYHWEQAGDVDKATECLVRAGDQAREVYAHEEAVEYYRRALALLEGQEGTRQGTRAQTLMKLGLVYHQAFDYPQARRAYEESFALWQRRGEQASTLPLPAPQTLRLRWLEPATLDPALSPDNHTSGVLMQLFSGLVTLTPKMSIVPEVAQSWDVSEDGRRYVFHLRDDARWSDGAPVTAHDFEYAWKRALSPDTGSPSASFLYDIQGARAFHRGEGNRDAVGVRATDETTLLVELEEPTGYFLQLLVRPDHFPVPRHVVETHGAAWTEPAHLVTNGPFRLEAWQRGERLVLTRNPDYCGRFGGNVEWVELFPLTDWSARLQMYEDGGLDLLGIGFCPPERRQAVRARYAGEYTPFSILETGFLVFDVTRPPFDDVRVRRAFALATDREMLAEDALQGYVAPALGGLLPHGMPGHNPDIGLPYDPERARRLLVEAGYPKGRGFPAVDALACDAAEARTACLQSQWRDNLGVEIAWQTPRWAAFVDKLKREPHHVIYAMWVADYPDPDNFLRVSRAEIWPGWRDERYERLVAEAGRVMNQEERMRLYRKAEAILVAEAPILPLAYEREHLLIKPWVRHYPVAASKAVFWKDVVIEPHE